MELYIVYNTSVIDEIEVFSKIEDAVRFIADEYKEEFIKINPSPEGEPWLERTILNDEYSELCHTIRMDYEYGDWIIAKRNLN